MKTAIKLVLVYLGLQAFIMILYMIPGVIHCLVTGEDIKELNTASTLSQAVALSMIMMGYYLWKRGYISKEKSNWSIVSPKYLAATVIITLPMIWVLDALISPLHLPNFAEESFNMLQQGWIGILSISILAPILEELLFRGAITKKLLSLYSPKVAILLSALVFGVIHWNPAQVVPAFLIGLLLAWMYYRTGSLIPVIVIHIINNSLSVFLNAKYPEVDSVIELVGDPTAYWMLTTAAAAIVACTFMYMSRTRIACGWKQQPVEVETEIETENE